LLFRIVLSILQYDLEHDPREFTVKAPVLSAVNAAVKPNNYDWLDLGTEVRYYIIKLLYTQSKHVLTTL
jgi:hypothetical protein